MGGVFVESDEPFETGDFVVLDLTLPGDGVVVSAVISVSGVVRWRKGEGPCGLGIEILRISDSDRERLDAYLDYYAEEDEIGAIPV